MSVDLMMRQRVRHFRTRVSGKRWPAQAPEAAPPADLAPGRTRARSPGGARQHAGSKTSLDYENEKLNPDGTRSASLTGSLAVGSKPTMASYPVPEPSRFAATVLVEALKEQGVTSTLSAPTEQIDFKVLASNYIPENIVAEHVSPPLKEAVKVTLKVSQNLHASSMPFLLGALLAHKDKQIDQAGFDLENEFLSKAGLDLGGAAQSD